VVSPEGRSRLLPKYSVCVSILVTLARVYVNVGDNSHLNCGLRRRLFILMCYFFSCVFCAVKVIQVSVLKCSLIFLVPVIYVISRRKYYVIIRNVN
jgi:hypothetical protein